MVRNKLITETVLHLGYAGSSSTLTSVPHAVHAADTGDRSPREIGSANHHTGQQCSPRGRLRRAIGA